MCVTCIVKENFIQRAQKISHHSHQVKSKKGKPIFCLILHSTIYVALIIIKQAQKRIFRSVCQCAEWHDQKSITQTGFQFYFLNFSESLQQKSNLGNRNLYFGSDDIVDQID